jgi:hypothetical protein
MIYGNERLGTMIQVHICDGLPSLTIIGTADRVGMAVVEILRTRGTLPPRRITVGIQGEDPTAYEAIASAIERHNIILMAHEEIKAAKKVYVAAVAAAKAAQEETIKAAWAKCLAAS